MRFFVHMSSAEEFDARPSTCEVCPFRSAGVGLGAPNVVFPFWQSHVIFYNTASLMVNLSSCSAANPCVCRAAPFSGRTYLRYFFPFVVLPGWQVYVMYSPYDNLPSGRMWPLHRERSISPLLISVCTAVRDS